MVLGPTVSSCCIGMWCCISTAVRVIKTPCRGRETHPYTNITRQPGSAFTRRLLSPLPRSASVPLPLLTHTTSHHTSHTPYTTHTQGYGFNTFGEVVACWLQDIILVALVFKDRRTPLWIIAGTAAAFTAGCAFLLSPACPAALLSTMQASNIAIMALGSRLPQIVLNMRRGNAGMLSVTTCVLNVAGNAARIFTTLVLTGDVLMLGGACSQGEPAALQGVQAGVE